MKFVCPVCGHMMVEVPAKGICPVCRNGNQPIQHN